MTVISEALHESQAVGSSGRWQFANSAGWYLGQPLTDASSGTHCLRLVPRFLEEGS